ncbi:hypothetical protein D9758_001232 [Tetrapyrgos nigripes]|uniref:Uncharacterized protein n=1 Tax=Tetrapyrgos nigripes TaxID=182062 RepID=A0A8H5LTY5_9AGAR|nr:hypothetical protein D9758_001232 [Tetrapyrgos nigripes]
MHFPKSGTAWPVLRNRLVFSPSMSSSSTARLRREEDVKRAGEIQAEAAIIGGLRMGAIGLGLEIILHHTWPAFRRQRLPFKAYLLSGFIMTGLVFGAEGALLKHEAQRRQEENMLRRQARLELSQRGIIPTETEITRWMTERSSQSDSASS